MLPPYLLRVKKTIGLVALPGRPDFDNQNTLRHIHHDLNEERKCIPDRDRAGGTLIPQ